MFAANIEYVESGRLMRYDITIDGAPATCSQVLDAWSNDAPFRSFFTGLLTDSPFLGFRWETPALTTESMDRPFDFVLLNSPDLISRATDTATFEEHFTDDEIDEGIVVCPNLRGDATLIIPSPRTNNAAYGHFAAFVRHAPERQQDALWRIIGTTVRGQISDTPIWLSTAGGGVAWLHVRLDSRPKYYGYAPYRQTDRL